jgi:hypothetical protein
MGDMMKKDGISGRTCSNHAGDLGRDAKDEFVKLRERYKIEGLNPRDAANRAYRELKIEARWHDWKRRTLMGEALEAEGVLTPGEAVQVNAGYDPGLSLGEVQVIGDQEMSPAEQVKWAMNMAARVESKAEEAPTHFPNSGSLFWYQSAVRDRREFQKVVLRVEAPGGDPDNMYLQDSQYRAVEIEKQVRSALEEVGERLREMEKELLSPIDDSGG